MNIDLDLLKRIPKKVAVGWSGGADSTALVFMLLEHNFEVQLWHVDHAWSKESAVIAEILENQALAWGVSFQSERLQKPVNNIEAQARKGRYQAFEKMAKYTGCQHIMLGHHANDQAETVCMRLLQGAGVSGCQGMHSYRKQGDLNFFRPLLQATRQQIESYLVEKDITWLQDPSNADVQLWRNKIRHQLFVKMEASGYAPQALFLRWQAQAAKVQITISSLAEDVEIKRWQEEGVAVCAMDWAAWLAKEPAVRVFLLQKMIGTLFADGSVFGRRHILAIEAWREHGGHGWLNLSGCCLYKDGESLQLCQGNTSLRSSAASKR